MVELDPALVTDFQRDGVVYVRGVFGREWLSLLEAGIERNLREPGPLAKFYTPQGAPGRFFGDYCSWRRLSEYEEFLKNSPAAELAGLLMGSSRVNLFHEHVLVKDAGTLEKTPWHHDQPYWTVDGDQVCSIWISVDPVPRETSPEFVRGSHRWGVWYTPRRFVDHGEHPAEDPNFRAVPNIDADRDSYDLVSWELEPGDCVVFHGLTLHGAPGNRLSTPRRAMACRFTGDDARYVLRSGFMSPPPQDGAPEPGAPMDSAAFPVVWRRESVSRT